ncbi:unnamed protein product [Ceutorhynchus assimilis]|uniref:Uncharacterized protein n=1 Tax=Ceutorhynchus assimilis TaxID=467358 RepID=A0A9N9MGH3_9CUCU|nr:unnamed protein product [Ceutorhynchus assimilis]
MKTQCIILVVTSLIQICQPQDYGYIDDIPIESYDHGDHQENEMDLELLPVRHGRSFSLDEDSEKQFFRSMKSFDDLDESRNFDFHQNNPRHSFHLRERNKRNTPSSLGSSKKSSSLIALVKSLGKPLEITALDTRNLTEKEDKAENRMTSEENKDLDDVGINDFIRFRRSTNDNSEIKSRDLTNEPQKSNPLSEKLFMEIPSEDSNREARGAIKEHWAKQVYPVRKSDELTFDDSFPLSSENARTPRVHFVTQKFADNRLAPSDRSDRSYDREPRSRQLDEPPRELTKEFERDIERQNPYNERIFRSFSQPRSIPPIFRDDLYPRYDLHNYRGDVYRPRYENYERTRNDYSFSGQKPQKRIIYYATLPEISRSPPNLDLRDRYRYDRDRYDDRYLSDPYRFRKTYPKLRYEDEGKSPYPVKVLTDVNVREVKKNPERRIYSKVDRTRYAYNTPPYRAADG